MFNDYLIFFGYNNFLVLQDQDPSITPFAEAGEAVMFSRPPFFIHL